jgi:NADPH-dependent ferric siderophore reductase
VPGGLDQFLYLLAPPAGRSELPIDQSFTWEQYGRMATEDRPVGAYYTVRRWLPERGELDIIVVLHGDEGEGSAWAQRASRGDPVALWGPRTAFEPPEGTDGYLLVADETGLPAVGAILEALAPGTPVDVFVELAGPEDRLDLPTAADARVTWFSRDGAPPGTTGHLQDAVRRAAIRGSSPYAWGGAESHVVTAVRKHLRRERGFERAAVSMTGYWRLGGPDPDDNDNDDDA